MKRFLSLVVLCFCVLLASPKYIGDVNGDGVITVADVTAMVNILVPPSLPLTGWRLMITTAWLMSTKTGPLIKPT